MTTRTATCSCGQLTVTTTEDPVRVSICHCLACQRRTGSVFGAQARFRRDCVEIKGKATQFVREGGEGGKATFSFCPICGATVYYTIDGWDSVIAVPVGAFAEPGFPQPTISVYEDRMHAWITLPGDIERMA